jgi:hypothetical protein
MQTHVFSSVLLVQVASKKHASFVLLAKAASKKPCSIGSRKECDLQRRQPTWWLQRPPAYELCGLLHVAWPLGLGLELERPSLLSAVQTKLGMRATGRLLAATRLVMIGIKYTRRRPISG